MENRSIPSVPREADGAPARPNLAFCLSEDRVESETGLRLAILSVCRHCPGTPVYVYRPALNRQFPEWLEGLPQVKLIQDRPPQAYSWNCKPQALLPLLALHSEVVWLDSDIILTKDCRPIFAALGEDTLAVTQEPASLPHQGTEIRTNGWGFDLGRALPFTLNSSVVRVTRRHIGLLERWTTCLSNPDYVAAQKLPLCDRRLHLMGDQDILNALLGAREFSDIPLFVFRSGSEIIHAGGALGHSVSERLAGLFKVRPWFFHAAAGKPWLWLGGKPYWSKPDFFGWHRRLLQETSPYVAEARKYQTELAEETRWMRRRTPTGLLLRLLGLGHHGLRGLPVTIAATFVDNARTLRSRMR